MPEAPCTRVPHPPRIDRCAVVPSTSQVCLLCLVWSLNACATGHQAAGEPPIGAGRASADTDGSSLPTDCIAALPVSPDAKRGVDCMIAIRDEQQAFASIGLQDAVLRSLARDLQAAPDQVTQPLTRQVARLLDPDDMQRALRQAMIRRYAPQHAAETFTWFDTPNGRMLAYLLGPGGAGAPKGQVDAWLRAGGLTTPRAAAVQQLMQGIQADVLIESVLVIPAARGEQAALRVAMPGRPPPSLDDIQRKLQPQLDRILAQMRDTLAFHLRSMPDSALADATRFSTSRAGLWFNSCFVLSFEEVLDGRYTEMTDVVAETLLRLGMIPDPNAPRAAPTEDPDPAGDDKETEPGPPGVL